VQRRATIDKDHFQWITDFLKEYNFIVVDETKKKIKLNKIAQKFLSQAATTA
jgi:hypothetical protein